MNTEELPFQAVDDKLDEQQTLTDTVAYFEPMLR